MTMNEARDLPHRSVYEDRRRPFIPFFALLSSLPLKLCFVLPWSRPTQMKLRKKDKVFPWGGPWRGAESRALGISTVMAQDLAG